VNNLSKRVKIVFNLESIEETVKSDKYLTIKDLQVEPVSFKNGVYEMLQEFIAYLRETDEDNEN
jgi:hypothetical protein